MRRFPRGLVSRFTAGTLAAALCAGVVTSAPAAVAEESSTTSTPSVSQTAVTPTKIAKKAKSDSSTDNSLSSDVGSSELQSFYDSAPEWGQLLLALVAGGLLLESFGFLVGPVRLTLQQYLNF